MVLFRRRLFPSGGLAATLPRHRPGERIDPPSAIGGRRLRNTRIATCNGTSFL
ncbi:hypothetical protein BDZ97DRAFT_1836458 [Flammula alnicola]|nr:hypothetical protein BDZ97DRAFT_1836458 [Flammula alnicola]